MSKLQPLILSRPALELNIDKWKANTPHNILFIVGQSGSGKTYLSKLYKSKDPSIIVIHLDDVLYWNKLNWDNKPIDKGNYDSVARSIIDRAYIELSNTFTNSRYSKLIFIEWFMNNYSNTDTLYILEGTMIAYLPSYSEELTADICKNEPIIIMRTSSVKSFIQCMNRKYKSGERMSLNQLRKHIIKRNGWSKKISELDRYLE